MANPRKITDGRFSQAKFNDLVDGLNSATVKPGVGYRVKKTTGGTILEIKPGKAGSAESHPFKAITSVPYTGEGTPPSNQGLKFKVLPGIVVGPDGNTKFASNKTEIFTAANDISDGYFCWLDLEFMTNTDDTVTFVSMEYDTGETIPAAEEPDAETGAVPTHLYIPLFYLTTADNKIDGVVQLVTNSLQTIVQIQTISCTSNIRYITLYGL